MVLDECHRPLRGQADRVSATVTLPDGSPLRAFARLPADLRLQSTTAMLLLTGDTVARLGVDRRPVTDAEGRRLRQLRTLLDAATLGPLHRATACTRLGPTTFALHQPTGAPIEMELRAGTLLVERLGRGDDAVLLREHLRTPAATWIVQVAESAPLGRCRIHVDFGGIDWASDFFALPSEPRQTPVAQRLPAPGANVEPRSPTPVLVEAPAVRWVVVGDPGDWPGRVACYRPLHAELERQDQVIAGFPVLWHEQDRALLAAPFRQRPQGAPLAAPPDWQLRDFAAGRWLVVYPADGDLDARLAAGERMLRATAAAQGLTPRGPLVAQPQFHLQEGPPSATKLAAPVVRMALPVQ